MADAESAPKVFVSHGSEDKKRFVMPFAIRLRQQGVDAWVDEWEIRSGDSLVRKVFVEGIGQADAFVVVLSNVSVTKPWVLEELDAAVVRRIESGGERRLIPVVLDEGVEVPAALRHLKWESVPKDGLDGVVAQIVATLFNHPTRPSVGPAPVYASPPVRWTGTPTDDTVLDLYIEMWHGHGSNFVPFSEVLEPPALERGIDRTQFLESMHALVDSGLMKATAMAGGVRWMLAAPPDSVWLRAETHAGVDLKAARARLLALIVNDGVNRIEPAATGLHTFTVGAILREFDRERLMTVHLINTGDYTVNGVSPLAARALRELQG